MPEQFTSYLHLYGALPQTAVAHIVRGNCIQEELSNLDEILAGWRTAVDLFRQIEVSEQGLADNNMPMDLPITPKLQEIQNNPLFKNSFSVYPSEFKIVEIDRLVAPQRRVSLDHVEVLMNRIPQNPTMDQLVDFCISPNQGVPIPKDYQVSENQFSFSSPSIDFRFLGGFLKRELSDDDMKYCLFGGLPVGAMILFYGYGAGSLNVLRANNRLILNNGFHRVYALKKKGIDKIPVVVQNIGNPDLEMAPAILGLSRDYLLRHPRPVLVKDFFVPQLTKVLRVKNTVRTVRVQWGVDQNDMPV